MRTRGLLVGALLLTLATGSGCTASKETRHAADELRDGLGTPSWSSAVEVRTGVDGQFEDFVQVTVTLDGSAGPGDVAGFIEELPDRADQAGLDHPGLTFVAASGARLDVAWAADVLAAEVTRGVSEWFAIGAALGGTVAASARTDGGAAYVVTLGDGPASAVHGTYDTVASLTEPDTTWQVLATAGPLALELSGSAPPTAQQLQTWDALVGSVDRQPTDLPATLVSLHFFDRIVADFSFTVPDDTTAETFTVAAFGDRLWPVIRPQLAALAALPDPWTYAASWHPSYAEYQQNIFVSLLSDQAPIDNGDESTRWSHAAEAYVDGL